MLRMVIPNEDLVYFSLQRRNRSCPRPLLLKGRVGQE